MNTTIENLELLKTANNAIIDKFGQEVVILDISELSTMTKYFIITNGANPNQVKAIADNADHELSKIGCKATQTEGYQSANWILLDFGDIILHVFDKENREFYNLERVWGDAKKITLE